MTTNRPCVNEDDGPPHDHAGNPGISTEKHEPTSLSVEDEMGKPPDGVEYPRMTTLCILTVALMLSVFMIGLDTNIIGTAIPTMTACFHSLNDVGWYGSAYLMTQLALQPTFGKLYTLFNIKFIYIAALLTFELGSTICAAAPSSTVFILGRAISGAGSAGIWSGAFTIGTYLVTLRRKPLYISIVTSMYGVAAVAGPLLGGVFTDSEKLTWRFCFWINLPVGAIAILIIAILYKPPRLTRASSSIRTKLKDMDFAGTAALISAFVCLLLALQWGGIVYPWKNARIWGCLIGFGALILIFAALQLRKNHESLIPLRLLTQRTLAFSCIFVAAVNMAIDTHIYYLPFYFQAVKNTSAQGSGTRLLPYLISVFTTAFATGVLITTFGYYVPLMWLGAALLTVGCGLIQTLDVQSPEAHWFGYQVLTAIGFGMAFQIPYTAAQVVLPAEDLAMGNALIVFFQALGGALAISIGQNVLSSSLHRELARVPQVDPRQVITEGATRIGSSVPPELMDTVRAAYSVALSRKTVKLIATPLGLVSEAIHFRKDREVSTSAAPAHSTSEKGTSAEERPVVEVPADQADKLTEKKVDLRSLPKGPSRPMRSFRITMALNMTNLTGRLTNAAEDTEPPLEQKAGREKRAPFQTRMELIE
ncbi:MAG: hypothetical protein Q9212_002972 [Teloschistes hypoglaucus]